MKNCSWSGIAPRMSVSTMGWPPPGTIGRSLGPMSVGKHASCDQGTLDFHNILQRLEHSPVSNDDRP